MLLHLLSLAYFLKLASISLYCSSLSPFLQNAWAKYLPNTIPSSKEQHPPWPRSGAMGWKASPTTQTLPLLIFPNTSSHWCLYLNGDVKISSVSVFSIKHLISLGIFSNLFNTNLFILAGLFTSSFSASEVKCHVHMKLRTHLINSVYRVRFEHRHILCLC